MQLEYLIHLLQQQALIRSKALKFFILVFQKQVHLVKSEGQSSKIY